MARRRISAGLMLLVALVVAAIITDETLADARKSGGGRSGGSGGGGFWSSLSSPKKQSLPQTQHHQPQQHQSHGQASGNSQSSNYGWNVPSNQKQSGGNQPKPSAPASDHMSKTSASNVHSSYPSGNPPPYSPSGGYSGYGQQQQQQHHGAGGHHQGPPPPYSAVGYPGSPYASAPAPGYHGNPPPYPGASGGGYQPYSGMTGHGFSSSPGHGYNPTYGHSVQPQTVVLQAQQQQRPGIGQLAKEAFVFAGVSAGVNAAVNRILPGGIYGHSGSSSSNGVVPPVSHTQITYNNYYNNGSAPGSEAGPAAVPSVPDSSAVAGAAPAAVATPAAQVPPAADAPSEPKKSDQEQSSPPPPPEQQFAVSDDELQQITEEMFASDDNNAFRYINVRLQGQKTDDSTSDDAPDNLLEVKPEAYEIPTIKATLALHDNYELDVRTGETVTSEERREESELLDAYMASQVMQLVKKRLAARGLAPDDDYEFRDALRRMWFSPFKRIDAEPASSGFETVFLAERFDNEIIGLHDWIYFARQEEAKQLNYLGYIKKLNLGEKGMIIKGRSSLNGTVQPITTILVGTSPELEMALYTLCFYARPNLVCPVSLGGGKFIIVANRFNYFGKDIIVSAFPDI